MILLRFDRVDAITVRDDDFRKCVQQNLYDLNFELNFICFVICFVVSLLNYFKFVAI